MFKKLIITLLILAVVILSCSDDNLIGQKRDVAAPGAVGNLAVGSATDVSLTLSWSAPGDDGSTGTATTYDIRFSKDSLTSESWATAFQADNEPTPQASGSAESFVISGLTGGTKYYFAMLAADDVPNWSTLSNVASGMTSSDSIAPARITDLAVIDSLISSVVLTWTASGDDTTDGTAKLYDIRYDTMFITDSTFDSAFQCTNEPTPRVAGSLDSFTVTGLAADVHYFFAIKVADEASNMSDSSNVDSTTTRALTAVSDLAVTDSTTTSISLTWSSPGNDGNNTRPITYDLRYYSSAIDTGNWSSATTVTGEPTPDTSGGTETYVVTSLSYYTNYYFAVRGVDSKGNLSDVSNVISQTTKWSRFTIPSRKVVGDQPQAMVAVNVDGDSDIDLVVANKESDNIKVLLNNGTGSFTSTRTAKTGEYPEAICAANVDGDADMDIITACLNSGVIMVHRNTGTGTFTDTASYSAGADPIDVCAGDFDGDGDIDIAVANESLDSVTILYNDGTGKYPDSTTVMFAVGDSPRSIITLDLDGDNDSDLVVSNYFDDSVSVLLNEGDSTFASAMNYYAGDGPRSISAALIDGDANLDLAVININANNVSILLGDGSGGYGAPTNYAIGTGAYDVTTADLDNDGDIDLAIANYYDDNVAILLNDGSGIFGSKITYIAGDDPRGVVTADFDGDTYIDVVVSNLSADSVSVLFNRTADE